MKLLLIVLLFAQTEAPKRLVEPIHANLFGDVIVPGHQGWRHIHIKLPPNNLNPKRLAVWVDDFTHPVSDGLGNPLPEGLKYDPRHVHVTTKALDFDATAGDHIFWRVGQR